MAPMQRCCPTRGGRIRRKREIRSAPPDHSQPMRSCQCDPSCCASPTAWGTTPRHYGPWEQFASLLTEGLVAAGNHVTLFSPLQLDHCGQPARNGAVGLV